MAEQCGRDALAMLTLACHGDIDGAYDLLETFDEDDVDVEHVLIDLAGMAGQAVHKLAALGNTTPDNILQATGADLARHEAARQRIGPGAAIVFLIKDEVDDDE